ncbi:MAG: rod shape-determining protein MreC [Candidatus Moraniibacteriota bacterium]
MNRERSFFQKNVVRALFAGILVWSIVTFVPNTFFSPLRSALAPIVAPFQGFISWMAFETGGMFHFLSSISELKQNNDHLSRENQQFIQDAALLAEAREENRLLREMLELPKTISVKALSAEVISRDMEGVSSSLTINRGSMDDVRVGMPVVVGSGQLVGRIFDVHLTSANVHLLSHPESTIAGQIAGTSVQGVIRGDHGLGLIFDMALSSEKLEPGARIVTSGLGDKLLKELYIGEIGTVRPSADRLFQQAVVVTPIAQNDIRFVSILLTPDS